MNKKWIFQKFNRILANLGASARGFIKDDCFSKASSLTFYTLMSIIPVLAVAFGIAKGFGFESYMQSEVHTRLEQSEIANQLISFSYKALEQAHGGVIASIGLLLLLWTSVQLLSKIESSLNEIWEVRTQRPYGRQLTDYLAIIIFCPIFFVLSSSLSIYATTLVTKISDQNALIQVVSPYLLFFLKYVPFILNWILFSFIYLVLPNTSIQWRWAIFGGIFAGTLYQILNWIYIQFQIGVAEYSAIYGSFAALPLFLVWVNLSWQIVLLGAEIAYHFELTSTSSDGTLQMVSKKYLGLAICTYCCSEFLKGKQPVTVQQIAHEIGATTRVIAFIASELFEANILAVDQHGAYLPAKNPRQMSMKTIFDALEEKSLKFAIMSHSDEREYENSLSQFDNAIHDSASNMSLNDLAEKLYEQKTILLK